MKMPQKKFCIPNWSWSVALCIKGVEVPGFPHYLCFLSCPKDRSMCYLLRRYNGVCKLDKRKNLSHIQPLLPLVICESPFEPPDSPPGISCWAGRPAWAFPSRSADHFGGRAVEWPDEATDSLPSLGDSHWAPMTPGWSLHFTLHTGIHDDLKILNVLVFFFFF